MRTNCFLIGLLAITALAGCASRPINEPITQADPRSGYRPHLLIPKRQNNDQHTLFVLSFSGGGTRAAAFSYGVLEELRRTEIVIDGRRRRMIDEVDVVTGVSGGSFTALAYALYGDRLFSEYEQRFLKRDVEGTLLARGLNPFNWWKFVGGSAGRSELAAEYYDEILFEGATFGDLLEQAGAGRRRNRDRHLDRIAARVLPAGLRSPLLGPEQGSPLAGGGHVLCGPGRPVGSDVQQLRRHVRLSVSGLGPGRRQARGASAAGGARGAALPRDAGLPEQQGAPVHSPRRWGCCRQPRDTGGAGVPRGAVVERGVPRGDGFRRHPQGRADRRERALGSTDRLGPTRDRPPAPSLNCCRPPACRSTATRSKPSRP